MNASREAAKDGRKHLTREKREEASRMAFNMSKKSESLGEAAAMVSRAFGISFTTAQSWIRRGRHLVNKAKKAKEPVRR